VILGKFGEPTLHNCLKSWGSVRKVRYLTDLHNSVRYALENAEKEFSKDSFREYILIGRQRRLELIRKHDQDVFYTPMGRAILATKRLWVTLPDTLVFLKNIGVFRIEKGRVHLLPLARKLGQVSNQNAANLILIEAILKSKYSAYWCSLWLLNTRGSIKIPRAFAHRRKSLRSLLWEQGVRTDVASFYTIRDLFYELEAVNWYIDSDGNEYLYPTIAIVEDEDSDHEWQYSFSLGSFKILYQRKISMDSFVDALVSSYMRFTRSRFDVEADLLSVRDDLCKDLRISDHQFSELLREAQKYIKERIAIRLSFGSIRIRKRNYALKITTLPQVSSDRLALYIRLSRRSLA